MLKRLRFLQLMVGLCLLLFAVVVQPIFAQDTNASVINMWEGLNVRSAPDADASIIGELPGRTPVLILTRTRDNIWFQVQMPDGQLGWAAAGYFNLDVEIWQIPIEGASPSAESEAQPEESQPQEAITVPENFSADASVSASAYGGLNLRDAINGTISFSQADGKYYELNDEIATLLVRPRGWHLNEKHMLVDGEPVSGGIFDFALYLYHNAQTLLDNGSGPYFYLPKLESHLEARLWNEIFVMAQDEVGVPQGSIRATVLIETILAAFEMDEILYELRDHSAGLNCGRWDYIFSCIKKFRNNHDFCLADRAKVTMTTHFMRSYSLLCIKTCHRRNIHAMGGMAAQIPIKGDPEANEAALSKVRADKEREANDGHDGTWVAHPGLVPVALEAFNVVMPQPNQIDRKREDVNISAQDLLTFEPEQPITEPGLRTNVNVGIQYLGSWLAGNGCVPIFNLMEDAATAEISRSQIWQWINSPKGVLDDGRKVDVPLFRQILKEELPKIREYVGDAAFESGTYEKAAQLFDEISTSEDFVEFLTLPAYKMVD